MKWFCQRWNISHLAGTWDDNSSSSYICCTCCAVGGVDWRLGIWDEDDKLHFSIPRGSGSGRTCLTHSTWASMSSLIRIKNPPVPRRRNSCVDFLPQKGCALHVTVVLEVFLFQIPSLIKSFSSLFFLCIRGQKDTCRKRVNPYVVLIKNNKMSIFCS